MQYRERRENIFEIADYLLRILPKDILTIILNGNHTEKFIKNLSTIYKHYFFTMQERTNKEYVRCALVVLERYMNLEENSKLE